MTTQQNKKKWGERCPKTGFPIPMLEEMRRLYKERQMELKQEREKYWWCIAKGCTRTRKNEEEWVDDPDQFELVEKLVEEGQGKAQFSPYCNIHTTMVLNGQM